MILKHFKLSQPEKNASSGSKQRLASRIGIFFVDGHYVGHYQSLRSQAVLIRSLIVMLKWIGQLLPENMLKFMKQLSVSAV